MYRALCARWQQFQTHPIWQRGVEVWLPRVVNYLRAEPLRLAGATLGGFALLGIGLVLCTEWFTADRIARAERAALLRGVETLVPAARYDNDPLGDVVYLADAAAELGAGQPVAVYRARRGTEPVVAIFNTVAPDGYSGAIKLLVAVQGDGTLAGVRVVAHKETPGLGDALEAQRSDWILQFTGLSLRQPPLEQWKVKRDGGRFDQFTGATISPRAVVNAVRRTLVYFAEHRAAVFSMRDQ